MSKPTRPLILIDGKLRTSDISFVKKVNRRQYLVIFTNNSSPYYYPVHRISLIHTFISLEPHLYQVSYCDEVLPDVRHIYRFECWGRYYWRLIFKDNWQREYMDTDLLVRTWEEVEREKKQDPLRYLHQIAQINRLGIEGEEDRGLLAKIYERMERIDPESVALPYLYPNRYKNRVRSYSDLIFPFGVNASQRKAVEQVFSHQISVIQGPPGTGKTQTILNIIANIVRMKKTVLIVSNNNPATANILEKLDKVGLGFIVASLGSLEKRNLFIDNQPIIPTTLSSWSLSDADVRTSKRLVQEKLKELKEVFTLQEEQAHLRLEHSEVEVEWSHFVAENKLEKDLTPSKITFSSRLMRLWLRIQTQSELRERNQGNHLSWCQRINFYTLKLISQYLLKLPKKIDIKSLNEWILEIKTLYYLNKRREIALRLTKISQRLERYNTKEMMDALVEHSMKQFKDILHRRYTKDSRSYLVSPAQISALGQKFLKQYPVVLSTTFSSRSCLLGEELYDYVIIDEASQVSIDTATLALSCAKNAVVVGDLLQLPNVVTPEDTQAMEEVMKDFDLPEAYDCTQNSILKSIVLALPNMPNTLLREHYRCHPRIINFCNQKFYGGQLLIMTQDQGESNVLSAIRSPRGNHAYDNYNQREIDIVSQEVLPYCPNQTDLGIITPYNNQVTAFTQQLPQIEAATVHSYQGRERDTIIMSVVDNYITPFVDDARLLNVAVSRAKKAFHLVLTGNPQEYHGNIMDLLDYIQYNNCSVTDSKVASIFDYLYEQYTHERMTLLQKYKQISEYASENLAYRLIQEILSSQEAFSPLKLINHIPLRALIQDFSLLDEEEVRYLSRMGTHIDFLIISRVTKKPILAIEVDGYSYHQEGMPQAQRDELKNRILQKYSIPLLRLSTKGSMEREKIESRLMELCADPTH